MTFDDISTATMKQLIDASFNLASMRHIHENAVNDPRYEERFNNQPEREINPEFLKLEAAIAAEITSRNKTNV